MPAVTDLFADTRDTVSDPLLERLRSVTIGEYEIRGEIGRGGMAVVFLAKDIRLERTVAIKVMLPELLRTEGMAERFLLEARISARLQHPNIIIVHDARRREEIIYFVMGLVDGCGLDEIARAGIMLPIDDVRWVLTQAAQALSYANAEGIVHRDVKPANILLTVKGAVLVTDFGIAKVVANNSRSMGATIIGTPLYMSPEQITGQRVSEASDQYSLGITAYALLAGNPPFSGDLSLYDLQTAHVRTRPVPLQSRRPDCPPVLAAAVMRMLEKRPDDRWPSLHEVVSVLGKDHPNDGLDVRLRLGTLARRMRNANTRRSRVIAIETPVTPRPGAPAKPKPTMIVVSPPSATLYSAAQLALSAKVMTSSGVVIDDAIVAWTSSDDDVATVTPAGALLAVGPGTVSIRAAIGSVYGDVSITVVLSPITRLELSSDLQTLMVGETDRPVVRAIDAQGQVRSDAACSWLSRNPRVVQVVRAGELLGVAPGDAAVEVAAGTIRTTLRVRVTPRPAAIARVLVDSPTIEYGDAVALRIDALDDSGAVIVAPRVTWSSDAPHVIHVDAVGIAIGLSPGRATITANVDGVSGVLVMMVVEAPIAVVTIIVEPNTLEPGDSAHVALKVTDASGRLRSEEGITVESDNPSVIRVLSDQRTLVAVGPGDARVMARLRDPGDRVHVVIEPALVYVRLPVVARVLVSSPSLDLEIGAVVAVTARCQDSRRRQHADAVLTWRSLDLSVVTVDERGQVRALGAGQTTIRVTAVGAHDSAVSADIRVLVRRASIVSVQLSTSGTHLLVGESQPIQAVFIDRAGAVVADCTPTWSSSDTRIARVDNSGVVDGVAPGAVTISAQLDGQRGDLALRVERAPLTAIRIVIPESVVVVGDLMLCRVIATDAGGDDRLVDVRWSVVPANIASVAADGSLLAHSAGSFVLIADGAGLRDERAIVAQAPTIARVIIEQPVRRLRVGARALLKARAQRSDGRIIEGVPFVWTVSDGECLQLTPDGSVVALRAGPAVVCVVAGDQRAELKVVVPGPRALANRAWQFALGGMVLFALLVFAWSRSGIQAGTSGSSSALHTAPFAVPPFAGGPASVPPESSTVQAPVPIMPTKPMADRITIQYRLPQPDGILVGDSVQFKALSRLRKTPLAGVSWKVSDAHSATISRNGLLVALGAGATRVTASTASDSEAQVTVTVSARTSAKPGPPQGTGVIPRDLGAGHTAADSARRAAVLDSIAALQSRRMEDSAEAARQREAQRTKRVNDSAIGARDVASPSASAARPPSDQQISSAIRDFVTTFQKGPHLTEELKKFFKDKATYKVSIAENSVMRDGASVSVSLTLQLEKTGLGPKTVERVKIGLRGELSGEVFRLAPDLIGKLYEK